MAMDGGEGGRDPPKTLVVHRDACRRQPWLLLLLAGQELPREGSCSRELDWASFVVRRSPLPLRARTRVCGRGQGRHRARAAAELCGVWRGAARGGAARR